MKKAGKAMMHGTSDNEGAAWGQGEFANMPQDVYQQMYPKESYKELGGIDDTAMRLASDAKHAERGDRRNLDRGMY